MAIITAQRDDDLWLSLISIWEIAKRVENRRLTLDRPLNDWLDAATIAPGLHLAELTRPILVDSCAPPPFVGDPRGPNHRGDRPTPWRGRREQGPEDSPIRTCSRRVVTTAF
jgi:hypothetical protein